MPRRSKRPKVDAHHIDTLYIDHVTLIGARLLGVERCRLRCTGRQFAFLDPTYCLGELVSAADCVNLLEVRLHDKEQRWRLARNVGKCGNSFLMTWLLSRSEDEAGLMLNFAVGAGEKGNPEVIQAMLDVSKISYERIRPAMLAVFHHVIAFNASREPSPCQDALYLTLADAMMTGNMTKSPVTDMAIIAAACSGTIETLDFFSNDLSAAYWYPMYRYAVRHDQLVVLLWAMAWSMGPVSTDHAVVCYSMRYEAIERDSVKCFAHILHAAQHPVDSPALVRLMLQCATRGARKCYAYLLALDSERSVNELCYLVAGVGSSFFLQTARAAGYPWVRGIRGHLHDDPETLAWAVSEGCPEDP
jgi:hypothetical protein